MSTTFITFPVVSSNIASLGHNESAKILRVSFKNGRKYEYENVSKDIFETLLDAESVGKAFNALIKSQPEAYPFKQAA